MCKDMGILAEKTDWLKGSSYNGPVSDIGGSGRRRQPTKEVGPIRILPGAVVRSTLAHLLDICRKHSCDCCRHGVNVQLSKQGLSVRVCAVRRQVHALCYGNLARVMESVPQEGGLTG